jgi:nucleoside-diphosphate-sugar epimerase
MDQKVALVAGASGVIGRGIVDCLARRDDWRVIALAHRPSSDSSAARFISVDLLDPRDCHEKLGVLADVTHVFYAAYKEQQTESGQVAVNGAMLRNLVEVVEAAAPGLAHISQMQGTKAYGCHFGPFKTPAKESDPRHLPPNFYYDQEDFLRQRQEGKSWTWSALRPDLVIGPGHGHPMNLIMVIAVYATICRALGIPLWFPGTRASYSSLFEATDVDHLARAAVWAATEPRCGNQVFNITNGDYFRWEHLWPGFARFFDIEPAPPLPIPLGEMMADKGPLWDHLVTQHGLRPCRLDQLVSWGFGEFVFRIGYDVMSDTTKARLFGFHDVVDTEAMFSRKFTELRQERYIP